MGALHGLFGAARYVGRTAGSIAADVASAAARAGDVVTGAVRGTTKTPGTVRLTVLILRDEKGVPLGEPEQIDASIARADAIFAADAGLRIRHVATHVVDGPAPTASLDPRANKLLLLDEAVGRTTYYHNVLARYPDTGSATDVVGRPVTALVVRDIAGNTTGCSLGISADWVVVQAALFDRARLHEYDETVLAHEIGHALNLPHHPASDNLMYFSSSPPDHLRGTGLVTWQRAVVSANRHVVPGISG
jgi:hypothetical protein